VRLRRYWLWKVVVEELEYGLGEDEFYVIAKDLSSAAKKAIKAYKKELEEGGRWPSEENFKVISVRLLGTVWI